MAAIDGFGHMTFSQVLFKLATPSSQIFLEDIPKNTWSITPSQALLHKENCTNVSITFSKRQGYYKRSLISLIMSTQHDNLLLYVTLDLHDCPLGFLLNSFTGHCECHPVLIH